MSDNDRDEEISSETDADNSRDGEIDMEREIDVLDEILIVISSDIDGVGARVTVSLGDVEADVDRVASSVSEAVGTTEIDCEVERLSDNSSDNVTEWEGVNVNETVADTDSEDDATCVSDALVDCVHDSL